MVKSVPIKFFRTKIGLKYLNMIKQNTKLRSEESVKILDFVFRRFLLLEFNFNINNELSEDIDKDLIDAKAEYIIAFLKAKTKSFGNEEWQAIAKKYAKVLYIKHVYFIQHIVNFICNDNQKEKILFKNFIENSTESKLQKIKRDFDIIPNNVLDILFENANKHMKIIIGLFMTTGMRVSALANIKKENIDFEKKSIITIEKGNKEVEFKIPGIILDAMIESNFFSQKWPSSKIRTQLKTLAKMNNVLESYIHPHAFRHTYATMLVKQKVDPQIVSKLLHHSNVSVTYQYYVIQTNYDVSVSSQLPYADGEKEKEFIPLVWKWVKGEYKC